MWMPILARTGSLDAVEHEGHLPEFRRDAGRRRREDHVDRLEQLQHLRAIPAAEFLRAVDQRRRDHRARQQAVAHRRIEIVRPLAQAIEMQRGAFGRGDDIGRGAGARGFGNFDRSRRAKRLGDARDGLDGFRENIVLEIAAGDRDPQTADVLRQQRRHRLGRPRRAGRIVRIRPLHRVIGQREIADVARERAEMIEARDERKRARARQPAVGRLQARKCRRTTTAPGSSRWCPSPAPAAPARRRPRRRSRRTSRRSSASRSCGLREGPSCTFSPVKS